MKVLVTDTDGDTGVYCDDWHGAVERDGKKPVVIEARDWKLGDTVQTLTHADGAGKPMSPVRFTILSIELVENQNEEKIMSEKLTDVPKKTDEEIQFLPPLWSLWKHYKNHNTYIVVCNAIREHDQVPIVIYRKAGLIDAPHFARPFSEWNEILENGIPRFSLVN